MSLNFVTERLLTPNKLQHNDLLYLLDMTEKFQIDYSDLYFQSCLHETWTLEDSIIKSGSYTIDQGAGVRVIIGEQTGFAYTDQLTLDALIRSMKAATSITSEHRRNNNNNNTIVDLKKHKYVCPTQQYSYSTAYSYMNPLSNISKEEKIELLMRVDKTARATDSRVQKVNANLSGIYEQILIAATDGILAADIRPLVRLSILVQVEKNGKREQGISGGGGRFGYDFFLDTIVEGEIRADYWAKDAVRMSLTNLEAVEAPAGTMTVVLGSGWPGILLHEAVGHGLEGDFNRRGSSIFSNKIGKIVASELCTIVDDATLKGSRGSLTIDDEGIPGQYNILIQNGILKGYMQDKLNAKLMGCTSTGNGRRESYAALPIPRMTNTYMLSGQSTPEEIIDSVDYGVYAANFSGGQVDITSGKFVFSASEAFLIEKGRITKSIKGATLIGSSIEIMKSVSMVGNDLSLDTGIGTCIKNGQNIPVSVGQPTIKLNNITVGGTN
ncbi:metalloprotease TldD [Blochmannia endosymbiont of Camponotus sp. C-046]|uniref:metalloprotease TldD n=1 Tax=Blochmannia endosymbiont of Camponotus sp. C-046 TaxID=2945589 RepID=UPI002025729E|nr:metalloprotease TldD [Blochmannia endosymbiont of Camponotus sp. C-046]URJ28984.1 metalloprotease TldD [Blochmannia endosymbiont of Camponotus sp. C-046]